MDFFSEPGVLVGVFGKGKTNAAMPSWAARQSRRGRLGGCTSSQPSPKTDWGKRNSRGKNFGEWLPPEAESNPIGALDASILGRRTAQTGPNAFCSMSFLVVGSRGTFAARWPRRPRAMKSLGVAPPRRKIFGLDRPPCLRSRFRPVWATTCVVRADFTLTHRRARAGFVGRLRRRLRGNPLVVVPLDELLNRAGPGNGRLHGQSRANLAAGARFDMPTKGDCGRVSIVAGSKGK